MSMPRAPLRVAAISIGVFALSLLSCGREVTAPREGVSLVRRGMLAVDPQFPRLMNSASLAGAVDFEKVRVVLRRTDGTIALDTVVLFPKGVDTVSLSMDVPLGASTGATGENLKLSLGYINAVGDTVFKGGPVDVTVVPKGSTSAPPPAVVIPVVYSGTGSTASGVAITPTSFTGYPGDRFAFTAVAVDLQGHVIPNTPIIWATSDASRVILDSNLQGTGGVTGARGTAKLYAQLLTGQVDSVTLTVQSRPQRIELVSGDNQSTAPTRTLANPLVVRVLAADGQPASGVVVSFSTAAGTLTPTSATSDASGLASSRWTLSTTTGHVTATASAAGLAGGNGTVTFNAHAVAPRAIKLAFESSLADVAAGATLPALRVAAQDSTGTVVPGTSGTLTIALTGGTDGARLGGTLSANLVNGVATFSDLTINRTGTGYRLVATTDALTAATSGAFAVTEGAATGIKFLAEPANGTAGRALSTIRAAAVDAQGNTAARFTGPITLRIGLNPGGGSLGGTVTRNAVAGVAVFTDISVDRAGGGYTLAAAADGLAGVSSARFDVAAAPAALLTVVRGANQSAPAATTLDTIVVTVTDSLGNPIAGTTVEAKTGAGNGTVTVLVGTTDATGMAILRWTLGPAAGSQQLTVDAGSLRTVVLATAVSSAVGGPMKLFLGFDDLNITTGVPTALSVFITAAQPSPVTVALTTLDTLSRWTTSSVVIPAGATSTSATILGRLPGASRAVATATGAGADTVNLTVAQATIRLFDSYMYLGANRDTVETRVELSAPAPAGGLTVSFDLSTTGIVSIVSSPGTRATGGGGGCLREPGEPSVTATKQSTNVLAGMTVTVKAGETQAYIYVISDTAAGSTNITPIATGYGSQTAYVDVTKQVLSFSGSYVLSIGSKLNYWIGRSTNRQVSQSVTFTARTPGVVQVPAVAVIRAQQWSQQINVVGAAIGTTWVVATAPGYNPDSLFVEVRRPALVACCSQSARVGSMPSSSISVYAYDSTRAYSGYRASPLSVSVTSSNPAVASPVSTTLTIDTDNYGTSTQFTPVSAGNAYIIFSAPGFLRDSVWVSVDGTGATASWNLSWPYVGTVGTGQYFSGYFYTSDAFPKATNFSITSSNPSVVAVDSTVLLPAGTHYGESFRVVGVATGTSTITWSAPGFVTNSRVITVTSPTLGHSASCCLVAGGSSLYYYIYVRDSLNYSNYRASDLDVSVASTDTSIIKPTSSTVTIYRGNYYSNGYVQPKSAGTAALVLTAPGHRPDTISFTVSAASTVGTPTIAISSTVYTVGKRQTTGFSFYRSGGTPAALVSIAKRGGATAISDTAFSVSAGATYLGFITISALNVGSDTLIFSAPGHVGDTVVVKVTTPKIVVYGTSGTLLQNYPWAYVELYLADSLGNSHYSMDTLRFSVTSTDSSVMRMSNSTLVIEPGNYYSYGYIQLRGPGTARFRINDLGGRYAADSTALLTVLQPQLHFSRYWEPMFVGMRQRTDNYEMYVYTDYSVLVPTWVKLQRSTAALVTMPDSLLIPANSNYAYFGIAGRDTVGGLQVQASAPGFASATKDIVVSRPGFGVYGDWFYTAQQNIAVEVRAVETGGMYTRTVLEDVPVTLVSDSLAVAGIDSSVVTIPAGSSYSSTAHYVNNGPGNAYITASDARSIYQRYLPGSAFAHSYQAYLYPADSRYRIGVGQRLRFYTELNFSNTTEVLVTLTGTGGHTSRTGTSVDTVPPYYYYHYSSLDGTSAGTDTVVLSSPGFRNGRMVVEVSQGTLAASTVPLSMKVGDVVGLNVYLRSPDNSYVEAAVPTTLTLAATNGEWRDGTAVVTSGSVATGAYYLYSSIKATVAGTATFTISAPGYLPRSFNVQVIP